MAHKISVTRIPHINKDGSVAKKKQDYLVRCRSRGNTCLQTRVGSADAKDSLIAEHRAEAFTQHRKTHPNDLAHVEKHAESPITKKQAVERMAPRGKRGLRWFARGENGTSK